MAATGRNLKGRLRFLQRDPRGSRVRPHMAAVAAAGRSRLGRLRYVTERRGFLATLLIAPAVLFIAVLVGIPLVLPVYLTFTAATPPSLPRKCSVLPHFTQPLLDP